MNKLNIVGSIFTISDSIKLLTIVSKLKIGCEIYLSESFNKSLKSQTNSFKSAIKSFNIPILGCHAPAMDINIGAFDEDIRQIMHKKIIESIYIAKNINASWLVVHLGFDPRQYHLKGDLEYWIKNAKSLFEKIKYYNLIKNKLEIRLENNYEDSPNIFLRLLKVIENEYPEIANKVRICLDVGHLFVYTKHKNYKEWIETLANYINEVHIHDNNLITDEHLPIGDGIIPYYNILKYLDKFIGLENITITIEVKSENDLKRSLTVLKQILNCI
jgi:sugar phosphate isomerase/epimerase